MAGLANPIASATGGLEFSRLTSEEVRKISAKRIHVTPALDTMLGPIPGGLYDPALGAIQALDINCSTCRMNAVHCTGHCGHIDLPVPCYHPQYLDITLRLLRSKCVYCHRFRTNRNHVSQVVSSLRLLQHGLIEEYESMKKLHLRGTRQPSKPDQMDVSEGLTAEQDEEEDIEDLIERRERFVSKAVRRARKRTQNDRLALIRNPAAYASRKQVISEFIKELSAVNKCASCQGISPTYRKDRNSKIFKKPLTSKAKEAMKIAGKKEPNPLIFLLSERRERNTSQKPLTNGWHKDDVQMKDAEDIEIHGAEDEIAMRNALETAAQSKVAELENEEDQQSYMTVQEVHAALTLLFEREQEVLALMFSSPTKRRTSQISPDMFFLDAVLVPPNRFRPLARQGPNQMLEDQQNAIFNRIIKLSQEFKQIMRERKTGRSEGAQIRNHNHSVAKSVELQEAVNTLVDSAPGPSDRGKEQGIKQRLEKKEGLFRMHMMGKRVNFAARSVISPDPNIESSEIGVPLVFARKLTYPEPVTSHNFEELSKAVINGADKYPGAVAIENENGMVLSLKRKTLDQRKALAKQLMTSTLPSAKGDICKKVYRHLQTGDVVIMNRQPTLHKPSMMGHRVRVLNNQKTIRMHYANCNTYNADFDGDEMNMHFPQNELARIEALQIADTDHQYLSATAGKPLRGLIQDHISMGVQFTNRDIFFDKQQYQQLLYSCLRPEDYHTVFERIQMLPPAIFKPKMLWTGKQIISTVLKNITPDRFHGLNLTSRSSTSAEQWGETATKDHAKFTVTKDSMVFRDTEQVVIFKDGEHLCGILDKSQLGPSAGGLIHSVYELYGHITAGKLLSTLGRLLTRYLNERAWSCGMEDLYLTNEGEVHRRKELNNAERIGLETSAEYVTLQSSEIEKGNPDLNFRLENVLRNGDQLNGLDQIYKSKVKAITDNVSKLCLPAGLKKPFPRNQMQAMTISGAKGSNVNANLISCNLGQQVLEGKRVPIMVSGKSLPSFRAFETHPGAGGYVSGRFLTGINPQEYFHHAMSGREGLIDTAVKTASSGYLQRCIIKGLEGARTEYDTSVREASNGSIVQFLYGEDGLEVTKQKHLKQFTFMAENYQSIATLIKAEEALVKIADRNFADDQKTVLKSLKKRKQLDPITSIYPPANNFGSTSEDFALELNEYIKKNPDSTIKDKQNLHGIVNKRTFQSLMNLKYLRSIVDAGEAVGVVAGQSIGEPSTQMTLNTFHLAGHSAKNVTLGIPRLREIVMTGSASIMTPTMTLKPIEEISVDDSTKFAKSISKLSLAHVIEDLSLVEKVGGEGLGNEKLYEINIKLYDPKEYQEEYAITIDDVLTAIEKRFLPKLDRTISDAFKRKAKEATLSETTAAVPHVGASVGRVEEARVPNTGNVDADDEIDEELDPDDAKDAAVRGRQEDQFDEPDEDEQLAAESSDEDSDLDEKLMNLKKSNKNKQPQILREQNPDDSDNEETDSENETRETTLKASMPNLKRYQFSRSKGKSCRIAFSYDSKTPKLLLLPLIEKCAHSAVIQSIPGLGTCSLFMEEVTGPDGKPVKTINSETGLEEDLKEPVITTQGVNLLAMRDYQDIINPHSLYTNSVHDMLKLYGVEAARMTIINEIDSVFKGHGISVDNRHLNLVADAMTQTGSYKPFNRHGLVKESSSILAKMSFETVMGFLKEAVLFGESDPLLGPSARIVAGRRGLFGTGLVDIVQPVH